MQQREVSVFLQSLRGAQPVIVLAYLLIQRAMTLDELESLTGLDNDTVRKAVKGLADKGMLYKQVGERGKQTWLPGMDTLFGQVAIQNPKFSDSGATTTTVKLTDEKNKWKLTAAVAGQNPKFSDSDLDEHQKAIWNVCKKFQIGEPMRTRIALQTDYPPEYILAHCYYGANEGLGVGLIIHRIWNQDWLPELLKQRARDDVWQYYDVNGKEEKND